MAEHTWKNTGAPFPGPDGERIERGETFRADEWDRVVVMRRRKLVKVAERPEFAPAVNQPRPTERELRFPGIDFGSDVAYEVARDSGLVSEDFEDVEGSGQDGAFLKSDVEAILGG